MRAQPTASAPSRSLRSAPAMQSIHDADSAVGCSFRRSLRTLLASCGGGWGLTGFGFAGFAGRFFFGFGFLALDALLFAIDAALHVCHVRARRVVRRELRAHLRPVRV